MIMGGQKMTCRTHDELYIEGFIQGYVIVNLYSVTMMLMKKSNDNNPQVKEVVDEYIKLNYGDIPADLLGECIQLAKKCNCEEFNEKAEPIYDKYFSYLSTTYIYKEAKEKAKENLERKRCIEKNKGCCIRKYFEDYNKYYPERWNWNLKNTSEQNALFMQTRARRSRGTFIEDKDLLPDFYSIERDANQFGLNNVEWTDFFGLTWIGKKGVFASAGAPDYEGSLYYYDPEVSNDESGYCISEKYNAYNNQPPKEIFTRVESRGIAYWIDTANPIDAEYSFVVNNHLFKDTYIEFTYDSGEKTMVFTDYGNIINDLQLHHKEKIVKKILKEMNNHFEQLRDSESEEIRKYYPGKTAEEMFLKN